MVKIEKKTFLGQGIWDDCNADCCMMLYDVVCHHLPLVGSGGDPLYIKLYQTTTHPRSTWTCCFYPINYISCSYLIHPHVGWSLVAIAVGSPFSDCNWQQGLVHPFTMWGPPVIKWFINPINYSYRYYKP